MCYSRSKNFKSILPKKYPELTVKEQKNGSYIVEGIYDNIYQKIIVDSVFKEKTKHLFKLLKDNGLIKLKFSLKSDPDNAKTSSLNHILNYMYKYCEPKFRQRFKGLGELDHEELYKTTLDPNQRKLVQVFIDNYEEALKIFEVQMGNDPNLRKEFLLRTKVEREELGE